MPRDRSAATVYGVTLVKKDDGFGPRPKGAKFRAVFRSGKAPDDAERFAWRVFQRDRPSENPMAWEVESVG